MCKLKRQLGGAQGVVQAVQIAQTGGQCAKVGNCIAGAVQLGKTSGQRAKETQAIGWTTKHLQIRWQWRQDNQIKRPQIELSIAAAPCRPQSYALHGNALPGDAHVQHTLRGRIQGKRRNNTAVRLVDKRCRVQYACKVALRVHSRFLRVEQG